MCVCLKSLTRLLSERSGFKGLVKCFGMSRYACYLSVHYSSRLCLWFGAAGLAT